ncbi:MAG: SHOCT domain-containing protein [Candidatus Saliniplasma sp.]
MWPIVWIAVFLVIGIFVYRDAEKRGMNGLLWLVHVILPMVGVLFLIVYLLIRGDNKSETSKSQKKILDERYALGDITDEEYKEIKEGIRK